MTSGLLSKQNPLPFVAGVCLALISWKYSPPEFLVKALALASGIGWVLVAMLFSTVLAFVVGFSESQTGHLARRLQAWLHILLVQRLQKASAFFVGSLLPPALVAVSTASIAPVPAVLLALILLCVFVFYGYGLQAMAESLRTRGYLQS